MVEPVRLAQVTRAMMVVVGQPELALDLACQEQAGPVVLLADQLLE
jgi:hypothetical protein